MAKKHCKCEVVKVDDGEEPTEGWECKCFEVGRRQMVSAKGPRWQTYLQT